MDADAAVRTQSEIDKEAADFAAWKQAQYEVASRLRSDLERQQRRLERLSAALSGKVPAQGTAQDDDKGLVSHILVADVLQEHEGLLKETDSGPSLRPAGRLPLAQQSRSEITTDHVIKAVVECFPRAMNCLFLGTKQEMAKIQLELLTSKNRRPRKTRAIA
jgi:hypothetical protein